MLDPIVLKLVSIAFGLLFLLASVHKFSALAEFRATLAAYEVMPAALVGLLAPLVAAAECVLGIAWLTGSVVTATGIASALLLASYTLGITLNLMRGRVHIDCGCSMGNTAGRDAQLSWGLVARNVILVAGALLAILPVNARTIGVIDYLTLVTGILCVVFLYAASNQLLYNGAAIGSWRKQHD